MSGNKDEKFYKCICEKYIKIKTNDMLLEENNKILYVFREDNNTYYDYLHGKCEVHEYSCYKELFDRAIKNKTVYDLNNLKLFDEKKEWNFYLSFEELKGIGYGYMVKKQFPLIEKYAVSEEKIFDFFDYFTLEQLKDFEYSLDLYFNANDIIYNQNYDSLESKEGYDFNKGIVRLACNLITYDDFVNDYKETPLTLYDICLSEVVKYFRENQIKNLMEYGSDR